MHPLLKALSARSWKVEPAIGRALTPMVIAERYPALEGGVLDVLSQIGRCIRADDQSWLTAFGAFQTGSSPGFRWNEYEIMALESAET